MIHISISVISNELEIMSNCITFDPDLGACIHFLNDDRMILQLILCRSIMVECSKMLVMNIVSVCSCLTVWIQ